MSNSKMFMYVGSFVVTLIAMLIHITLMFETNEFVHFVCFFLWMIISSGIVFIVNHEVNRVK